MMNIPAITSIVHAAEWTPLQRLVMLDVVLGAEHHDGSRYFVLESSATAIASRIGCSVRIASDALHALVDAGVIEWHRDVQPVGAVNRYGEKINIRSASRARGDFVEWQHSSAIAVNPTRLETLPETLPTSTNTDRARRRAAAERDRVKRIEHELNELLKDRACPDCNAVGTLHAEVVGECTACGQRYRADELDAIIDDGADHVKSFHVSACTYDEKFSRGEDDAKKEECPSSPSENFSCGDAGAANIGGAVGGDDDDHENFSRRDDDLGDIPERLNGADAIMFLSSIGVRAFGRMISRGNQKQGLGKEWLDVPLSDADAIAHLHRSPDHLVGVLPEHGDYVVLDVDAGLSEFLALHPGARSWCRIVRSDAPDRAKLFVRIVGTRPKYSVRQCSGRKLEILTARRSAVIAGIHPDGMPYELVTGHVPVLDPDQLNAIIDAFIPNTPKRAANIGGAAGASGLTSSTSTAKRAIAWWCSLPSNIAQVEHLIEQTRRSSSGRHFVLRNDDRTPSTSRINTRYVYDHGSGTTYDLFDVWLILTGQMHNKRAAVNDVYREWHAAGRPG